MRASIWGPVMAIVLVGCGEQFLAGAEPSGAEGGSDSGQGGTTTQSTGGSGGTTSTTTSAGGQGGEAFVPCVANVDARRQFSCAALSDGSGWCFGDNEFGQLGNGATQDSATPLKLPLDSVVQVATSSRTTFALNSAGEVYA